jgi:hypothetical protein
MGELSMSDLPKSVGIPHRQAHRDYARSLKIKIVKPDQTMKQSDIMGFNQEAEKAFIGLLHNILVEEEKITYREALREGAYEIGISLETSKRYLEKHCARHAEFKLSEGYVILRKR